MEKECSKESQRRGFCSRHLSMQSKSSSAAATPATSPSHGGTGGFYFGAIRSKHASGTSNVSHVRSDEWDIESGSRDSESVSWQAPASAVLERSGQSSQQGSEIGVELMVNGNVRGSKSSEDEDAEAANVLVSLRSSAATSPVVSQNSINYIPVPGELLRFWSEILVRSLSTAVNCMMKRADRLRMLCGICMAFGGIVVDV